MLGPVLFLIFINDMPLQLQSDTDIYADDTITHTVGKKLEVVEPKLQNSADDCIDDASIIKWEFIMVKHMHSK